MDMSEVKSFNAELSGLYDNKPPISKAKMSAITKGAIKAIKFYKHVVHSVEKFIQKCKPEYKVPGLYVIDSIVRQSRHQFGQDKDVFAPRFAKNMQQTFANLFRCPPEDKRNIIRVLNLWQKNNVFSSEVIQPLLDMADPNHPLHQEIQQLNNSNGSTLNVSHSSDKISPIPQPQHTPHGSSPMGDQFQDQPSGGSSGVKFNRKLLNDFEYESEDDAPHESTAHGSHGTNHGSHGISHGSHGTSHGSHGTSHGSHSVSLTTSHSTTQPTQNPTEALGSILTNPEIMRQLQSLQAQMQMMTGMQIPNLMPMMSDMQMQQNQNLPFLQNSQSDQQKSEGKEDVANESDIEFVDAGPQVIEINDANDSRSPSPRSRRHRSRSKSPRRRRRDRSRSPRRRRDSYSHGETDREREREKERSEKERQREREKKGLPPPKRECLSVCSTTLWVGHLSKLATEEELWALFGAIGAVASIDVVAPRGCAFVVMERRRDAARARLRLARHRLHGKELALAWAPGRGVKGRDWKEHWEAELGVSYLPWAALRERWALGALSLDALEDGGAVDEDTLPPWLPPRIIPKFDNMTMMPVPSASGTNPGIVPGAPVAAAPVTGAPMPNAPMPNTPMPNAPMPNMPTMPMPTAPPTNMPMPAMPPPGMAGMPGGLPPGIRPPSLPASVPNMPTEGGMPPPGALLGFPPGMPPQPGMVGGFLGGLLGVGGLVPGMPMPMPHPAMPTHPGHPAHPALPLHHQHQAQQQPQQQQQQHTSDVNCADDNMELDTEDHMDEEEPPPALLPDQIQALLSKPPPNFNAAEPPPGYPAETAPFNQPPEKQDDEKRKETDRDRRDRDRDRRGERSDRSDRRDRDRRDRSDRNDRTDRNDRNDRARTDRDRDRERDDRRDRDRDRGRDRGERRDRDRDRDRDRFNARDNNREHSREKSPRGGSTEEQKPLHERLWEMANGKGEEAQPEKTEAPQHPPLLRETEGEQQPEEGGWVPRPHPNLVPPAPIAPLPQMPPFRPELRMRGPPRQPIGGPWMEGPGPRPFRFNGNGPPHFNRPPFERPPFEAPMFDGPPRFNRMPFDGPRTPRPPFDGPRPPFDGPRPPFDGPRPPFDGPRPPFDGPRPPFDGPRPPFDGPRPPFDGPRPPFDGPRPPFEGPRPPFEGPGSMLPFDNMRQFNNYEGDRQFDGPSEYFDRNKRFDEREQFNERDRWNGDRDRDWDRRNEWDDRRTDRRPHGDRFRDRNDRRRNFDDRSRNNDDRVRSSEDRQRNNDDRSKNNDDRSKNNDDRSKNNDDRPKVNDDRSKSNDRNDRNSRRERDRKSRWGAPESADQTEQQSTSEQELSYSANEQTVAMTDVAGSEYVESEEQGNTTEVNASEGIETESEKVQPREEIEVNDNIKAQSEPDVSYESTYSDTPMGSEQTEIDKEAFAQQEDIQHDTIANLYDASDVVDTSFINTSEVETEPEQTVNMETTKTTENEEIPNADIFNQENMSSEGNDTIVEGAA